MNLTEISIRRPVLTTMAILAMVVFGVVSYRKIPIDLMPKMDIPYVIVIVPYPGAGPQDIETSIVNPIENELSTLEGLDEIQSYSHEGAASFLVKFKLERPVDFAYIDVKDKIQSIRHRLPKEIYDPIYRRYDPNAEPVVEIVVINNPEIDGEKVRILDPREISATIGQFVIPEFTRIPGVASVETRGNWEREIKIYLDYDRIETLKLDFGTISRVIAASNLDVPGGKIPDWNKETTLRFAGRFASVGEIEELRIPSVAGSIRLGDIARVVDGYKDRDRATTFNTRPAVGLEIRKRSDANTVETVRRVRAALDGIRTKFPSLHFAVAADNSTFIEESVDGVRQALAIAVLLAAMVLLVFLHNFKATLIATVSMPISLVCALTLLYCSGFSLNFMTLLGLAISVGFIVNDSIVVLENIGRRLKSGSETDVERAAAGGAAEVILAVVASTMTNVVVFLPVVFMSGLIGRLFREFGLTILYATIFSLFSAFAVVPMLAAKFFARRDFGAGGFFARLWDAFFGGITAGYLAALGWVLKNRVTVLAAVFGLIVVTGGVGYAMRNNLDLFPSADQGQARIVVNLVPGTSIDWSSRVLEDIERKIHAMPGVECQTYGKIGGRNISRGVNLIEVFVTLPKGGDISAERFMQRLRGNAAEEGVLADVTDAEISMTLPNPIRTSAAKKDLVVIVSSQNADALKTVGEKLAHLMTGMEGVRDVGYELMEGKPEYRFIPMRRQIADAGLTAGEVALALRTSVYGAVVGTYTENNLEYDIRLSFDPQSFKNIRDVEEKIKVPSRIDMPRLKYLVESKRTSGAASIRHIDSMRVLEVGANLSGGVSKGEVLTGIMAAVEKWKADGDFPFDADVKGGGETSLMTEMKIELGMAFVLAALLTYMLLAALLESCTQPFIIMLTLPLGLIGVTWSLYLTDTSLNIFSLIAIVMLVGVVVNNGILLVDGANLFRRGGDALTDAVIKSAGRRFRPIVMANIAITLAMLPLALGVGAGAEFQRPMAIASIGGFIAATFFTLFVVPVTYSLFSPRLKGAKRAVGDE